jgi:psiF repeat
MRLFPSIIGSVVVVLLGTGVCLAQAPKPAAGATTTTTTAAPADADKKAISKACSDQANAKGLHGKDRKKFRSACKRNGGKEG